jgi:Ca2+/H+ antiporter, TMEM165/GDT1 family
MLTTFGTFWAVEGLGVRWPGDELAVVVLLAFTAAVAIALARLLRRQRLIERPLGVNP